MTDNFGDLSEGHAFFSDTVIPGPCETLLRHEPVEMRSIEPVHRGPAVEPFAQTPTVFLCPLRKFDKRCVLGLPTEKQASCCSWPCGGSRISLSKNQCHIFRIGKED